MTFLTSARDSSFRRIFGIPLLLGLVSLVGLLSALLGDAVWDALSWCSLGAPVAVVFRYWMYPPAQR